MDQNAENFLFDLLSTPSPTGFETPGQRKWAAYMREFADSVESDAYGNVWATVKGSDPDAPTLMLEAHADEIGYMVRFITDDGFLRIDRIGGSDWASARGRRVTIFGDRGEVLGVIGNTAIHLRERSGGEKAPEQHELYVDVGASKAEEVIEMGIRVGHPAVYTDGPERFGQNRIVGRALDNRIGGFIIAETLAALSKGGAARPTATVVALNAVQEEIGGYGARMAAHRLRPDVCVVLDVTHATDSPGIEHARYGKVTLGGGPSLTHGTVNHPEVVKRLMSVAADAGISLQHEASSRSTSTDTDSIFQIGDGIPSALVSLPLRYMHSVVEVADFGDVEKVIALLTGMARSIGKDDRFAVEI
ncbi:MAG: M42 family metallopeptidase [Verrucomicrobiae bacterium]|nr:M42 family metallopeptidase [Verrucomicrobiae bacterium]